MRSCPLCLLLITFFILFICECTQHLNRLGSVRAKCCWCWGRLTGSEGTASSLLSSWILSVGHNPMPLGQRNHFFALGEIIPWDNSGASLPYQLFVLRPYFWCGSRNERVTPAAASGYLDEPYRNGVTFLYVMTCLIWFLFKNLEQFWPVNSNNHCVSRSELHSANFTSADKF